LSDALVHYFVEPLAVTYYPSFGLESFMPASLAAPLVLYAIGKFAATLVISIILLYLFPKLKVKSNMAKALVLTAVVVISLELRYSYSGYYSAGWLVSVFILHLVLLLIISYIVLKKLGS
jgi:hypothetical protein